MEKKADIGSKRLISLAPERWAQWLTQRPVQVRELIDSEFQWLSREGDVLLRVCCPDLGEVLIANELQLRYTPKLPRRIRAYAALAEEKYQLPVYPVLVNILPPATPEIGRDGMARFEFQVWEVQAIQDFRVINLWEMDAGIVFEQPLPTLLPFVPIMEGGGNESTIQQAVTLLRQDEKLSELENLLAFFATFVLEAEVVQQILRWDMAVLRESPWYQQILQEGKREGIQEGERRGIQQGIQQGIQAVAQNMLQTGLSLEQIAQLTGLSEEQIRNLRTHNGH